MKRLFVIYVAIVLAIVACDFSASTNAFFGDSDSLVIKRYDRVQYRYFSTCDYSALHQMTADYPEETSLHIEKILKLGTVNNPDIYKNLYVYFQDSTLQTIIRDVESQYANIDDLNDELRKAFRKLKSEYPDMEIPSFYTQLGALDQSIVVGDKSVCISLDKYLGKDYEIYKRYYSEEQRETMSREYIVPDCIVFYLFSIHPEPRRENHTQFDSDMHMGILMWVANRMTGKTVNQSLVDSAEKYVAEHPDLSIKELMSIDDFSDFNK